MKSFFNIFKPKEDGYLGSWRRLGRKYQILYSAIILGILIVWTLIAVLVLEGAK